jgi:hypothetical protein
MTGFSPEVPSPSRPRQETRFLVLTEKDQSDLDARRRGVCPSCRRFRNTLQSRSRLSRPRFTREFDALQRSVRPPSSPTVDLSEAIRIEELLFRSYEADAHVTTFGLEASNARRSTESRRSTVTIPPLPVLPVLEPAWDEYLVQAHHLMELPEPWRQSHRLRITVPTFPTKPGSSPPAIMFNFCASWTLTYWRSDTAPN